MATANIKIKRYEAGDYEIHQDGVRVGCVDRIWLGNGWGYTWRALYCGPTGNLSEVEAEFRAPTKREVVDALKAHFA